MTTLEQDLLLARVADRLKQKESLLIFTPNAEMLGLCRKDPALLSLLNSADLLIPDGIGLVIAAKRARVPIHRRIPGIAFGEALLSVAAKNRYRVYLLGAKEGVAERAAEVLKGRFPSLCIAGTHNGYFTSAEDKKGGSSGEEAVLCEIAAKKPDFLFVCMGFPKQEAFLLRAKEALPGLRLGIGLGGSLDVWAGEKKRAPVLFQKLGLEWLYRAIKDPSRFARLGNSLRGAFG